MNILTIDYNDKYISEKFVESLHSSGFAIIKNHPIDQSLINKVYDDWAIFFNSSEKNNYLFDYLNQDGYFPFQSESAKGNYKGDLKEFYHIYPLFGRYPDSMEKDSLKLFDKMMVLGKELLNYIDVYTPKKYKINFSEPVHGMAENSNQNLMRVIHYPPIDNNTKINEIRAAAHTDINLITLLVSGSQPGLQIKDKNGKWIEALSKKGQIVVNIGDMLQECSNGYYPSTEHQVVNPKMNKNISRFSIPLFIHPRPDVVLSKRYTAESYLLERLKEIGLK